MKFITELSCSAIRYKNKESSSSILKDELIFSNCCLNSIRKLFK